MSNVVEKLGSAFLSFFARRAYRIDPPAPLLTNDPSLLFTNASVTQYKEPMLEARSIASSAVVQPCFRSNCSADRLSSFAMLGLIADYCFLKQVTADLQDFLYGELGRPGELVYLPHADDDDLIEAWLASGRVRPQTVWPAPSQINLTRWRYGAEDSLLGRGGGISFFEARNEISVSPKGWVLGTLIVIASAAGRLYVEVAIGAECFAAAIAGVDLFSLPPISHMVECLMTHGLCLADARRQADAARAVAALLSEGCTPGPRGPSYIMRKFIHRIDEEIIAYLRDAALLSKEVVVVVQAEHRRRARFAQPRCGAGAAGHAKEWRP